MDRVSSIIKENRVYQEKSVSVLKGSDVGAQVEYFLSIGVPAADIARGLNISIHDVHLSSLDSLTPKAEPKPLRENVINPNPKSSTTSKVNDQYRNVKEAPADG